MLESRVFMRFSLLRDEMIPITVYRTWETYPETMLVRGGPPQVRDREIWASPSGVIVFKDGQGELQELGILRPSQMPRRYDSPVAMWLGASPNHERIVIEYADDEYYDIVRPSVKAIMHVCHQTSLVCA